MFGFCEAQGTNRLDSGLFTIYRKIYLDVSKENLMFERLKEMHREMHEEHGRDCRHHRHGRGWWDDRRERWEAYAGGGRERFFDNGHLRLVILQLIADKPRCGEEIIKAIEERLSGGYAPSPGVVYPTLTLLEEEGMAVASAEGNKKLYAATEEGR